MAADDVDAVERKQVIRRLKIATILCASFMIVEIAGGLISGSLAILSDAAHLFADLASFAVAIAASYLASLPATVRHTYGLKRTESLAALFSMTSLAFVSVGLAYEAVQRLVEPPKEGVDGTLMSVIAGIGVVVNVVLAFVLGEHHVHLPGGSSCEHDHGHDHSHGDHGSCDGRGDSHGGHVQKQHHDEEKNDAHEHGHDDHDHEKTKEEHDHGKSCKVHDHGGHDHGKKSEDHVDHGNGQYVVTYSIIEKSVLFYRHLVKKKTVEGY